MNPDMNRTAMKALTAMQYGPIDTVSITEVPRPVPGPGQVLVRVAAAGLNPLDVKLATGVMKDVMPVEHPLVLGVDAAGTIEAVGEGVTRFAPGDQVVALTYPAGAIAEYTVVNDGPTIVPRSSSLPVETAAALPTPLLMAAALTTIKPAAGQSILLLGGDGAVASFFLQMVARSGARIIATAKPEHAPRVAALASDVIDYTSIDPVKQTLHLVPGGVDMVIDLVNAGPGLATTAAAARDGGRLISPHGGPPTFDRGVTATYLGVEEGLDQFAERVNEVASGELTVRATTRPFTQARQTLTDFAAGRIQGRRTVLTL
ncbi:NADP-dependent oxidoreductase [Microtetraspora fusca]|uniref:NADP-dependent oxidoreductase n=1 Tax=Microtetraspora fusca TaxID=1997 RepID=A0ABW6UWR1_MICFU